jgi:hypothetical protein
MIVASESKIEQMILRFWHFMKFHQVQHYVSVTNTVRCEQLLLDLLPYSKQQRFDNYTSKVKLYFNI